MDFDLLFLDTMLEWAVVIPFEVAFLCFEPSGTMVDFLLFLRVILVIVFPNEVSVGMWELFLGGITADLDLHLLALLDLDRVLGTDPLETDLTLDGAPPER